MIDVITEELHDEDFPNEYVHMAHPDDYKEVQEFTYHTRYGRHDRLIARVAWKLTESVVPMSFVCDTGAPSHLEKQWKCWTKLDVCSKTIETRPTSICT